MEHVSQLRLLGLLAHTLSFHFAMNCSLTSKFSALTFFINDVTSLRLPHFALLENGKDTACRLSRTDPRTPLLLITSRSESFMPRQDYDVLPMLQLLYGI